MIPHLSGIITKPQRKTFGKRSGFFMPKNSTGALLMDSLGLPRFETLDELSEAIRLSTRLLYCLSINTEEYYKVKEIPKRRGGIRVLSVPSYTLSIVQHWILTEILNEINPSERAMAFRREAAFGQKQNAAVHMNTLYGLSVDLKDFFPSIPRKRVFSLFSAIGYNNFAATILSRLCTVNNQLPQGASTSPALSNLICMQLDKRLMGLCDKRGIRYSRYADDMYFSCDDKGLLKKAFHPICDIIKSSGFEINAQKTHYQTPSGKKLITGITVIQDDYKSELKAPKSLKRKIRAEIHNCIFSGNYDKRCHILGEIAYVDYIERECDMSYRERIDKYISGLVKKISPFPELVNAYNENKFYSNQPDAVLDIASLRNEGIEYLDYLLSERCEFLKKHQADDICEYNDWPVSVDELKQSICEDDDSLPF